MLRKFLSSLTLVAGLTGVAGAGLAQSPEEQIIDSLQAQGFEVVARDRTWLGRIWLLVENGEMRREIVFNPATGEIMRDYTVLLAEREREQENRKTQEGTVMSGPVQEANLLPEEPPSDTIVVGGPLMVAPPPPAQ